MPRSWRRRRNESTLAGAGRARRGHRQPTVERRAAAADQGPLPRERTAVSQPHHLGAASGSPPTGRSCAAGPGAGGSAASTAGRRPSRGSPVASPRCPGGEGPYRAGAGRGWPRSARVRWPTCSGGPAGPPRHVKAALADIGPPKWTSRTGRRPGAGRRRGPEPPARRGVALLPALDPTRWAGRSATGTSAPTPRSCSTATATSARRCGGTAGWSGGWARAGRRQVVVRLLETGTAGRPEVDRGRRRPPGRRGSTAPAFTPRFRTPLERELRLTRQWASGIRHPPSTSNTRLRRPNAIHEPTHRASSTSSSSLKAAWSRAQSASSIPRWSVANRSANSAASRSRSLKPSQSGFEPTFS